MISINNLKVANFIKWQEVREQYPNKFVKLQVLEYHMEENKKIIDEMAVIGVIEDNRDFLEKWEG